MATSAKTYGDAIKELSKKYDFDLDDAIKHLAFLELLPKKLMPTEPAIKLWANKKAEQLAEQYNIDITIDMGSPLLPRGSGANGKITVGDIKKAINNRVVNKKKMSITPAALVLANKNKFSVIDKIGSGVNGQILLKDVNRWLYGDRKNESESESESESDLEELS